jgi:hypothetical protein
VAESVVLPFATSGWVKANFTITLYRQEGDASDTPADIADPGITVTENGATGDYVFDALPDLAAGEDYIWTLTVESPNGEIWWYKWPRRTSTPQAIAWEFQYGVVAGSNVLAVGDTTPDLQVDVTGLSSDPTASTVTWSMWCDGTLTIDGAAGAVSNITATGSTFSATLTYDWVAANTATAGNCEGRFKVVFAGGDVASLPPGRTVPVTILE